MIKYKNLFIGLLIVAFIFQISKFYTFYEDYSDWQYADWLINYQGGFVRRGLIGEILRKTLRIFDSPFAVFNYFPIHDTIATVKNKRLRSCKYSKKKRSIS